MDNGNQRQSGNDNREYPIMRWISFTVITILFLATSIKAIFFGTDINNVIAWIFIVITGTAWGANLWKTFIK